MQSSNPTDLVKVLPSQCTCQCCKLKKPNTKQLLSSVSLNTLRKHTKPNSSFKRRHNIYILESFNRWLWIGCLLAMSNLDCSAWAIPAIYLDDTTSTLQCIHDGLSAAFGGQLVASQIRIVTRKDIVIG